MQKESQPKGGLPNLQPNRPKNIADKNNNGNWDKLKRNIDTMQDDLAQLISEKNHQSVQKTITRKKLSDRRDIQRNLADVYTDGDGAIPDLTKLDRAQRPLWKTILYSLIGVLFVLFLLALTGFIVFSNYFNNNSFTNEHVSLKIEAPISLVSGASGTYDVLITNNEKVNLYDLNLQMFYPDNFMVSDTDPQAQTDKRNTWSISILKVGETQKIEFRGRLVAPLDSLQTFKAHLDFKPANLNAEFSQEAAADLNVASSIISLDISGPDKVMANANAQYLIKYKNTGEQELDNLQVVADFPKNFIFTSSSLKTKADANNVWPIAKLASGTEAQIKIAGNFSAVADSGNQELKAEIDLANDGEWYPQNRDSVITNVIRDALDLGMIINGSAEDQPLSFGDLLVYTINYKNSGQDELKNISLIAHLDSKILDWDTLVDANNGAKEDGQITWTGKEAPQLLDLRPGDEGSINFQIRVKDLAAIPDLASISKFSVDSYAEALIPQMEATGSNSDIKSKIITNSINSDITLNAVARYYDADNLALGSGPIQPKLGEISSYNIQWSLSNNLHDVADIEVTAALPKSVNWDNKTNVNSGDLIYNPTSRLITWKISKLAKTASSTNVDFNLGIQPSDADMGRILILLPEIKLSAKDAETGADISKSASAITTAFNDPILGQLSGIVE